MSSSPFAHAEGKLYGHESHSFSEDDPDDHWFETLVPDAIRWMLSRTHGRWWGLHQRVAHTAGKNQGTGHRGAGGRPVRLPRQGRVEHA